MLRMTKERLMGITKGSATRINRQSFPVTEWRALQMQLRMKRHSRCNASNLFTMALSASEDSQSDFSAARIRETQAGT